MDSRLNGFCTDFPFAAKEELNVPYFVNEDHRQRQAAQWRRNYDDARLAAAVGVEKKKSHEADKRTRNGKACLLLMSFVITLLIIAGAVG